MIRYVSIILAVAILAGCAFPRAGGTIKEQRVIQHSDEITVMWDVGGRTSDWEINQRLEHSKIYSPEFESCVNSFLQLTFEKNGYMAYPRKVERAALNSVYIDTPYVLLLNTKSYVFLQHGAYIGALNMLNVEGGLYEAKSGRLLWEVKTHFGAEPEQNNIPVLMVVRALADDGYLDRKIEDVVDYLGAKQIPREFKDAKSCP